MSNNKKFRLVLDVEIDPQGATSEQIQKSLRQGVMNVIDDGIVTGESSSIVAIVADYSFKVVEFVSVPPDPHTLMMALSRVRPTKADET